MLATSVVGRFDGVVSFDDGSCGSFHCQIESDMTNDIKWSLAETFSQDNIQRIYNDLGNKTKLTEMFETLPFISSFSWSDTAKTDKTIDDVVLHLYLLVTFDDGTTYPVSITYERDQIRFHTSSANDTISTSSNSSDVESKIEDMLMEIMQSATIS